MAPDPRNDVHRFGFDGAVAIFTLGDVPPSTDSYLPTVNSLSKSGLLLDTGLNRQRAYIRLVYGQMIVINESLEVDRREMFVH